MTSPNGPRHARGGERLHTIGAAAIAILAVLAGILIINLLNDPSSKKNPPNAAPVPSSSATPSPSGSASASTSPTASPSPSQSTSPSTSPSPRPSTKPSPRSSPRPASIGPVAPVYVYNNSTIAGLAATAADRVRAVGFQVKDTNGIRGRWPETTVYYDPPNEAAAHNLANRLGGVGRVEQRPSYVARTGTLILIVTKDFAAGNDTK